RLMSLQLIKNGMTEAVMFDGSENNVLPARVLYKKNILALRGSFRPVTMVNVDMFQKSYDIFVQEPNVEEDKTVVVFEITLSNLMAQGELDEKDFMDRAKLLCSLGHTVMISNFKEYYRLVDYFSHYSKNQMALAMGVNNFLEIFKEDYYEDLSGGILEAFGKMFYNLRLHPRMKEFYKFFKYNGKVVDIFDYEEKYLNIFSREILKKIKDKSEGWEEGLPSGIAEMIKDQHMFGYTDD
ncbi:MAG: TonB-dependent receptor, partial [Flavobacteriaceae bacterium]